MEEYPLDVSDDKREYKYPTGCLINHNPDSPREIFVQFVQAQPQQKAIVLSRLVLNLDLATEVVLSLQSQLTSIRKNRQK